MKKMKKRFKYLSIITLMNIKVLEEIKNSAGELRLKIIRLTNKIPKHGIHFESINELYKELQTKYKADNISIIAKPMDGNFVTLKSQKYNGTDLKHCDESYFSSLPKGIKDKLCGVYYSVDITISR